MAGIRQTISTILNHRFLLVLVVTSCLYTLGSQSDRFFGWTKVENKQPKNSGTIHTDGSGYYAYLPQWFIYPNSPHFQFLTGISDKYKTNQFAEVIGFNKERTKRMDKYFIGTAVCISPFFLINHWTNRLIYGAGDGYSKSYQFTISLAAIFYWLLGIIGFIKLLRCFQLTNLTILLSVIFLSLGTNINFFTTYFPSFSHVYSFCAITWFLFSCKRWGMTKNPKFVFCIAFLAAMIFILRPTNSFIVLIIPFLFSSWKEFTTSVSEIIRNHKQIFIGSMLIFLFILFFQLFAIHSQTGKWSFNTYSAEHFDYWLHPKWFEILFGYRKGFFVYSPIMFLLFPAIFVLVKRIRYFSLGWLSVFFILVYLTSSWWCWWYGGGLGMRPFADFISFLFLPIPFFIEYIKKWLLAIVVVVAAFAIYLYQTFQIQYNLNIIHYDIMTKETFWRVFLKTDNRFSWMLFFPEQQIDNKRIKSGKTVYLNPHQLTWNSRPLKKEIGILTYETVDPIISFKPDFSVRNLSIGIRFRGEMYLENQQSNPSFQIQLYKSGKLIKKSDQLIGNRIDKLNVFQPFSKDYFEKMKYNSVDSIVILMTKGVPITKIKNIRCTFYALRTE